MPVQTVSARGDINNAVSGTVSLVVAAGDTILVAASLTAPLGVLTSSDITDNVGNSYTIDNQQAIGQFRVGIWRAVAGTSATITITLNPVNNNAIFASWGALSFNGMTASPLDQAPTGATGTFNNAPATGNTSTLAQADEFVFAAFTTSDTGADAVTVPATSGYTNLWVQSDASAAQVGAADYKTVAATTAVSANWTLALSNKSWAAIIVTYKILSGQPMAKRLGGVPFLAGNRQAFGNTQRWIKAGGGLLVPNNKLVIAKAA